ncbi:MAG: LPS export ABC transporter permease LptF [Neomegalonema sp.]|nr:LPS export ABC transporter permease LptF [Neomegalonema sp.]
MQTLERYIFRQLLGPLGFFTLVLTGVVWLTQSLRILDVVVNNGQGAQVLLEFSALLLPVVLSIVLQLGGLIATVYALHRLISESEIIAALAGGASKMRLARPVLMFGMALSVSLSAITVYLMPTSARMLSERMAEVRGDIAAGLIRDGRFLNPIGGLTVYIREITSSGEMLGILVQDARKEKGKPAKQPVVYTAKRGLVATRPDGTPVLVMYDGQRLQLTEDGKRLTRLDFYTDADREGRIVLELDVFGDRAVRSRKASERYFWELIWPDPAVARTPKDIGKFTAEGHEQLSAPLYGIALPLVAAAALFSAAFSRRGMGGAVAIALIAGAGIRVFGIAMKNATTGAPELWPLMYLTPLAAIAVAIYFLMQSGMRRPSRSGPTRLGPTTSPKTPSAARRMDDAQRHREQARS